MRPGGPPGGNRPSGGGPYPAEAGQPADSRFAVLPQNTNDELALSEVHGHLDRALRFLQQDVGYALLDDARPRAGAGVRLRGSRANGDHEPPAVGRLPRSAKIPQESAATSSSCAGHRSEPPEDLDANVMELLRSTFERSGGRLRASELADQLSTVCQRQSSFRLNGQWDRLFQGNLLEDDKEVEWEDFQSFYGQIPKAPSDVVDILEMSPDVARHAHYKCDLVLVSRFAQLLFKQCLQDTLPGARDAAEAERRCNKAVKHNVFYTNILQAVRLLHLCNYDYADVVLVLAYASVYFRNTFTTIGSEMSPTESAHVVVLLIFLAHVFLLDETCPLRIWQKHIFRQYCTIKVLNAALFRVFQMRPGLSLRVSDEEESMALLGLSGLRYSRRDGNEEEEAGAVELAQDSSERTRSSPRNGADTTPSDADTPTMAHAIQRAEHKQVDTLNDPVISPGHCTTTDESD